MEEQLLELKKEIKGMGHELSGATMVYTVGSTGTWTITAGTTALTGCITYKWNYHVGGY